MSEIDKPILLFDGVCNFCNSSINFIIDRNAKKDILFSSLQSEKGQELLKKFNLPTENFSTLILVEGDRVYTKSTAALKIAEHLDGQWSKLAFLKIIPKIFRDIGYDLIAKNRYKLFGKADHCRMPTKELRERFLN